MSVSSTVNRTKTNGDGGTTNFPYGFLIQKSEDLSVYHTVVATQVQTPLVEGVDYTVNDVGDATGTIDLIGAWIASPPASGTNILCIRQPDLLQARVFHSQGRYRAKEVEYGFDFMTHCLQMVEEITDRCLKVQEASETDAATLTLETFAGNAPVDDSGFSHVLSGVSPATVQGCLDKIDTDAALESEMADVQLRAPVLLDEITSAVPVASMTVNADLTDYDFCEIHIFDVFPVDAQMNMYCQIVDSTGTPHTGANYSNNTHGNAQSLPITATTSGQTEALICSGWGSSPSVYQAYSARLHLRDAVPPYVVCWGQAVYSTVLTTPTLLNISFGFINTAAVGGIKIFCEHSSTRVPGNIARGTMRLWGLPRGT